jgi:hypothetical protein
VRLLLPLLIATSFFSLPALALDLSEATVVTRGGRAPAVAQTAATVLAEEIAKRTGIDWPVTTAWPKEGPVIALVSDRRSVAGHRAPRVDVPEAPEAYAISTDTATGVIWVQGTDGKGILNGVGKLLRALHWSDGHVSLPEPLNIVTAPDHTIRGHQLGYRHTANSYDAWTPEQYDQYIRELAFFGINAIENIPLQGSDSKLMPVTRQVMNRELGRICKKYGVQYWVWTPATIDLTDAAKSAELLGDLDAFFKDCDHLDALFFPGGDPGDNHPREVMPFLEDVHALVTRDHPGVQIWMSLQGFEAEGVDYFFDWLHEHQPDWFGGAVGGPSSPPLDFMRKRLPDQYALRDYPDITHTVRSQYPTPWIDPAFAFTSGREGSNPEPVYYSTIFRAAAPYTDGFITYSDGMHDDVNKTVWSLLGWDHDADVREGLMEYCRVFFGPEVAERAADGIYALERNWDGPLATNGGVEATLTHWQALDAAHPELRAENWRWQLCLLKAHYDAYIRARLLHEEALEEEANAILISAEETGAAEAIELALAVLARPDDHNLRPELRKEIYALCEIMFHSIGYQTSVDMYGARSGERGAVLDYVDHPLNNRWWYEDQFAEIADLPNEEERVERLNRIAMWENPGPGSFYDDIGNVAQSDHVIRGEGLNTDPFMQRNPNPDFMWWDNGMTRVRQSWISKMDWPLGLRYEGLDPDASYTLRTTGLKQCLLRVDGDRVEPTLDGQEIGEWKAFPIPAEATEDGKLELTFDVPHEPGVNWRNTSRLTEVWLLKQD